MGLRYLFGPVNAAFADEHLDGLRRTGDCLVFNTAPGVDLVVRPDDTWEDIYARLPIRWRPDFVGLVLAYTTFSPALWRAPIPVIGLSADSKLLWHHFRRTFPRCDLVLADTFTAERMRQAGVRHVCVANLFGLGRSFLELAKTDTVKDLDIIFVGNLQPAVQRERMAWLGRLARLGRRWRVTILTSVYGEEYRRLLARARIGFNRSIQGECNMQALEAAAAGALLFQETGNREVPALFREGEEYVAYQDADLEQRLEFYLTHEEQRRRVAEAGRRRVLGYGYEALWTAALAHVEAEWPQLQERAFMRSRQSVAPGRSTQSDEELVDDLLTRTWQALSICQMGDPLLVAQLESTVLAHPFSAALRNALGIALALTASGSGPMTQEQAVAAAVHFSRASTCAPDHVLVALNLVEALARTGSVDQAVAEARRALTLLDEGRTLTSDVLETGRFPPGFDLFRVEWERAAWDNAGSPEGEQQAKTRLLRWRFHTLLGELTGELVHFQEAARLCPDLGPTQTALGCALGRAGRADLAVVPLTRAVRANPFDLMAARALAQALLDTGDGAGQRRLAEEYRQLAQVAPQVVPTEPWFAQEPAGPVPEGALPADTSMVDGLTSIIILCCNEVEYTRLCVDSVLRHTTLPYELVLVDNGSTDDTPAYLESLRGRPGPAHVTVIRNETNRGFPAGCNQALTCARGRYLLFLNNDTLVSPDWLEGLQAWAAPNRPGAGLVGAVSNYTGPPQQVPVDYSDLRGLESFAARHRRAFAGQGLQVERLTGFCLLVCREVLGRVGGFDERFGLGFFDDDDLSVRAREAGFRLVVALDVFIHHFGSRTFLSLGVDCRQQLADNLELFRAKWGPERAAHYRLPDDETRTGDAVAATAAARPQAQANQPWAGVTAVPSRLRVSLSMIVKNEERNLPTCLESVADLVDEIVIADTGSTDRTKEVAARYGARVSDFPWVDSFAAARNASLRHVTGDWVLWLDADDFLDLENRQRLRTLFARLPDEKAAYVMKCLCLPEHDTGAATVVDHVRLFRHHPGLSWEYRVHEQILGSLRRWGAAIRPADVVIHHTGYQDPAHRPRKVERDLRLLRLQDRETPDDPFVLFNLGSLLSELNRPAEALPLFRRSLKRSGPQDSIVRKLYALIALCQRQLGRPQEALAVCHEGLHCCPGDAELLYTQARLLRELGDLPGAVACLDQLLRTPPADYFASVDPGLRGYKARLLLGQTYRDLGRPAEAEAVWGAAVAENPAFGPAWLELGQLYLAQGRWGEFEQAVEKLKAHPQLAPEAVVLRARGCLARKEFAAARRLLEEVITREPKALYPRQLLTHVLLQEGSDGAAAEKALRELLALDPQHAEARNNLAVLLRQLGRPQEVAW